MKANHKISLADAIALAQTIVDKAVLVTSDNHELDAVEQGTNVEFLWIR